MSSDHVMTCARWKEGRPTTDPQQDRSTWGLARWAEKHSYFGILPKYFPMRWVNLRAGNLDRRKPQICYICKTSYSSEEAMRNHARRDHKGHKKVEGREVKSRRYGENTGTTCPTCKKDSTSQSVTDVTGRTDRGTRQTCKRGQEQDLGGTRLDWDGTRRYFVSRNIRQDRSEGRNV